MRHQLRIHLLGGFALHIGEQTVTRLESRKVESLLAFLLLNRQRTHTRELLAGTFWPEMPEDKSRSNLRRALYVIRKTLGNECFYAEGSKLQLNPDWEFELDVENFEQFLEQPPQHPMERGDVLRKAVELYRGPFMDGYYDDWLLEEQHRLSGLFETAINSLASTLYELGQFEESLMHCQRLIGLQPNFEPIYRQKMNCHYQLGQYQQALQTYQACALTLQSMGVQPEAETQSLYEKMLKHEVATSPRWVPNNLPQSLTPFVGRETELSEVLRKLYNSTERLLTLSGSGGMGKTRMSLEVATLALDEFEHGVFFVALDELNDPDSIVAAIAQVLHLNFTPGGDGQHQLIDYLRTKKLLLVLDNFEHVMAGAGLLVDILEQAPDLKILVTSRESLKLPGEWVFELDGLDLRPSGQESFEDCDAVSMFVQTAQRLHSRFELTEADEVHLLRICELVQGVPLALELAATWVRVLSCQEIADEIQDSMDILETSSSDVPERHRSMKAVFEHSWKLLSKEERQTLRRLSVFKGSFHRKAAEAVTEASLSVLLGLIYKSLLKRDNAGLYRLPDVITQYATLKLRSSSRERKRILETYCDYYANWLDQRVAELKGIRQLEVLAETDTELANVRSAWGRAISEANSDQIKKFIDGLYLFFDLKGWYQEGQRVFESAYTSKTLKKDKDIYGRVCARLGFFYERMNQFDLAKKVLQQSLKNLPDALVSERAFAFNALGTVEDIQGDFAAADTAYAQSLELYRNHQDDWGLSRTLTNLGILRWEQGNYDEAQKFYEESLKLCQALEDQTGIARALNNLGGVSYAQDEHESARQWYQQSLEAYEVIGNRWAISNVLNNLGEVAKAMGQNETALEYHQRNHLLCEELGDQNGLAFVLKNLCDVEIDLGDFAEAERYIKEACAYALALEVPPMMLGCLLSLAEIKIKTDQADEAFPWFKLLIQHPASHQATKDNAQVLLDQLSAQGVEVDVDGQSDLSLEETIHQILNT